MEHTRGVLMMMRMRSLVVVVRWSLGDGVSSSFYSITGFTLSDSGFHVPVDDSLAQLPVLSDLR